MGFDRNRDEDTQQFTDTYPDEDFLNAIDHLQASDRLATATNIADHVGCHPDSARGRLNELADQGAVEHQQAGRTKLWRRID